MAENEKNDTTDEEMEWNIAGTFGACAGFASTYFYDNTGLETLIHEVAGHGYLGMRLLYDYPVGAGPNYWVAGFDKFNAIAAADGFSEIVKSIISWFFLPASSHNSAVGWAYPGSNFQANALAAYLGKEGTSAWISITGSLPGLAINAFCVAAGMSLRKKHPFLGMWLIGFGLLNNLAHSLYSWDAVDTIFSNSTTIPGHDFFNFANKMGLILSMDPATVSLITAFFFTGFVPLIALGLFLSEKTKDSETLRRQEAKQQLSHFEKMLAYATFASILIGITSQIIHVLSITIIPALLPLSLTLKVISPLLGLLSIVQSAYQAYKELSDPSVKLPTLAKALILIKFVITTLTAITMLVATLVPGAQFLFIPAALINTVSSISLGFAKEKCIQRSLLNTKGTLFSQGEATPTSSRLPRQRGEPIPIAGDPSLRSG